MPGHNNSQKRVRISASMEEDQVRVFEPDDLTAVRQRRDLARLESLVRCQVQHQWQISIDNYRHSPHRPSFRSFILLTFDNT